jgi:hypothetical protein
VRKLIKTEIIIAVIIAMTAFCIYLPTLQSDFTNWDDDNYVTENPNIQSLDARMIKWAFTQFYESNWHPLTWISHGVDVLLWGLNPAGHHLGNNILHALNTFLVIMLLLRLLRIAESRRPFFNDEKAMIITAATAGILFGIHPLHVESVAWIAERKDLLCGFFFLMSLMAYAGYAGVSHDDQNLFSGFSNRYYLLALAFFLLALLSKPMAVTLPVILVVLDWYPFGRINDRKSLKVVITEKIPFILLSLTSSIITVSAQQSAGTMISLAHLPVMHRIFVSIKVIILYLGKMILPFHLVPFYPYPKNVDFLSFNYLLPLVLVLGITIAAVILAPKRRLWLALWSIYAIMLLPVIGIIQVGVQEMADRYTYLPSIGPFLLAGLGASWLYKKSQSANHGAKRALGIAMVSLVLLALSYRTIVQIGIWKDSMTLWNYVIAKKPECGTAYNHRGLVYGMAGDYERALDDFRRAVTFEPNDARAHHNLGATYDRLGRYTEAFEEYSRAIELKPDSAEPTGNRAVLFLRAGDVQSAMIDFQKSCAAGRLTSCKKLRDLLIQQNNQGR